MNFENIEFHGTFRDYQQRVLDNANKYLKDGKINIVAAPGSGKTILGLELIRRTKFTMHYFITHNSNSTTMGTKIQRFIL